ncbi:unnamed protein product, partial [Protopolystoma xenopodis]
SEGGCGVQDEAELVLRVPHSQPEFGGARGLCAREQEEATCVLGMKADYSLVAAVAGRLAGDVGDAQLVVERVNTHRHRDLASGQHSRIDNSVRLNSTGIRFSK